MIPAYNAQNTIGDAVRSALEQTLSVSEIVVVDDGSTDMTASFVAHRFPQVTVLRVPNGGPSRARNYGLQHVKGDWVAFLDADDRWHPDKLRVQLAVADETVGVVASDWIRHAEFTPVPEPIPSVELRYRDFLIMNQFQTSTVIMRRSVIEQLGGFDTAVDGAEDWDFWLRAAQVTRIRKVVWPLVQYRDVPTGYSKDVWRVYETMAVMLNKHRNTPALSPDAFKKLEAWHHLRFWVAFILARDSGHARVAWQNAWQRELRRYVLSAAVEYLMPFLWQRMRRRISERQRR
ncbi:MAG: glycosyltransferase family A protein [Firmicutes bacterium]|nr:glycosyltransferase family A protein [Bacillota bacterium]